MPFHTIVSHTIRKRAQTLHKVDSDGISPSYVCFIMEQANRYFDENGKLIIRRYRINDLAAIYEISYKTMRKWMSNFPDELGRKAGRYYSIRQLEFMIGQFGEPRRASSPVNELPVAA